MNSYIELVERELYMTLWRHLVRTNFCIISQNKVFNQKIMMLSKQTTLKCNNLNCLKLQTFLSMGHKTAIHL